MRIPEFVESISQNISDNMKLLERKLDLLKELHDNIFSYTIDEIDDMTNEIMNLSHRIEYRNTTIYWSIDQINENTLDGAMDTFDDIDSDDDDHAAYDFSENEILLTHINNLFNTYKKDANEIDSQIVNIKNNTLTALEKRNCHIVTMLQYV